MEKQLVTIVVIIVVLIIIIACVYSALPRPEFADRRFPVEAYREELETSRFMARAVMSEEQATVIYVRHGHDEDSDYSHDQHLTDEGWHEAKKLARRLVKEYGLPDVIYYSPFDRTTDTARAMLSVVRNEFGKNNVKTKIEPRLGKFFTSKQRSNPKVSENTIQRGMIVPKGKREFHAGLETHHQAINFKHAGQIVWNVTHAIGVNYHIKRLTGKSQTVEYLQHIVFD